MRMEDVRAIRTMQIGSPDASDANFVLTRDQSIVDLAYEVRWSIPDPELFIFQLADPEGTIREVAESAMRATVANFNLVTAIGPGPADTEADVQRRMQAPPDQNRSRALLQGIATPTPAPPTPVHGAVPEAPTARHD